MNGCSLCAMSFPAAILCGCQCFLPTVFQQPSLSASLKSYTEECKSGQVPFLVQYTNLVAEIRVRSNFYGVSHLCLMVYSPDVPSLPPQVCSSCYAFTETNARDRMPWCLEAFMKGQAAASPCSLAATSEISGQRESVRKIQNSEPQEGFIKSRKLLKKHSERWRWNKSASSLWESRQQACRKCQRRSSRWWPSPGDGVGWTKTRGSFEDLVKANGCYLYIIITHAFGPEDISDFMKLGEAANPGLRSFYRISVRDPSGKLNWE
ncbi:hypothetical protein BDZ45DRAFT_806548 [Acephala macrosclerotiorum]|nr:hypothetical protein BDZ45DRAFT_806548 [Acephala macrosclerotiorum]